MNQDTLAPVSASPGAAAAPPPSSAVAASPPGDADEFAHVMGAVELAPGARPELGDLRARLRDANESVASAFDDWRFDISRQGMYAMAQKGIELQKVQMVFTVVSNTAQNARSTLDKLLNQAK